jgi:type I restriction enzyme M protein
MKLTAILKDSNYKLTQFTLNQIEKQEETTFIKEVRGAVKTKRLPHKGNLLY